MALVYMYCRDTLKVSIVLDIVDIINNGNFVRTVNPGLSCNGVLNGCIFRGHVQTFF